MPDVFAGRRRVPRPENDPNLSYAPGTPARAELKARLKQMAAETVDIPIIIGGKEIRTGATEKVVMPHKHGHVLGNFHKATRGARPSGRRGSGQRSQGMVELVVRRSRRRLPSRRRAADHDLAIDRRRRHHARPVEDRVPGRDRRRVGARRLLALQRRVCAGTAVGAARQHALRLEPDGVPAARRIRLRGVAVQLHRDRRQPRRRAGADGQRRVVEAREHRRC